VRHSYACDAYDSWFSLSVPVLQRACLRSVLVNVAPSLFGYCRPHSPSARSGRKSDNLDNLNPAGLPKRQIIPARLRSPPMTWAASPWPGTFTSKALRPCSWPLANSAGRLPLTRRDKAALTGLLWYVAMKRVSAFGPKVFARFPKTWLVGQHEPRRNRGPARSWRSSCLAVAMASDAAARRFTPFRAADRTHVDRLCPSSTSAAAMPSPSPQPSRGASCGHHVTLATGLMKCGAVPPLSLHSEGLLRAIPVQARQPPKRAERPAKTRRNAPRRKSSLRAEKPSGWT
jgi:hypothetical protein